MSDTNIGNTLGSVFDAVQEEAHAAGVSNEVSDTLSEEEFIEGAVAMGLDERRAQDIWTNSFGDLDSVSKADFKQLDIDEAFNEDIPPAAALSPAQMKDIINMLENLSAEFGRDAEVQFTSVDEGGGEEEGDDLNVAV